MVSSHFLYKCTKSFSISFNWLNVFIGLSYHESGSIKLNSSFNILVAFDVHLFSKTVHKFPFICKQSFTVLINSDWFQKATLSRVFLEIKLISHTTRASLFTVYLLMLVFSSCLQLDWDARAVRRRNGNAPAVVLLQRRLMKCGSY